jgi:hypothetical protein
VLCDFVSSLRSSERLRFISFIVRNHVKSRLIKSSSESSADAGTSPVTPDLFIDSKSFPIRFFSASSSYISLFRNREETFKDLGTIPFDFLFFFFRDVSGTVVTSPSFNRAPVLRVILPGETGELSSTLFLCTDGTSPIFSELLVDLTEESVTTSFPFF